MLQGVPSNLPLAILHIERLVLAYQGIRAGQGQGQDTGQGQGQGQKTRPGQGQGQETRPGPEDMQHCLSHLCSFLAQFDCPLSLKERLLPLLAELVRCSGSIPEDASPVLEALQHEAIALHMWESRVDAGFSVYMQALLEVSLALSEVASARLPAAWHKQIVLKMRTLRALVDGVGGARDFVREVWGHAIKTESGTGEWSRLIVIAQVLINIVTDNIEDALRLGTK